MNLLLALFRFVYLALLWLVVLRMLNVLLKDHVAPEHVSHAPLRRPTHGLTLRGRKKGATVLAVTGGPLAGTTIPLTAAAVTVGRADDNTLPLDDNYISAHHARVFPQRGGWWVRDLDSTNGTVVDDVLIRGSEVELAQHVPVQIGSTTLELR